MDGNAKIWVFRPRMWFRMSIFNSQIPRPTIWFQHSPTLLQLLLVSPKIGETNGVEPFTVNLEPLHMTKLNGTVEVGDIQEATREENFQNGAAYIFQRDGQTGTWSHCELSYGTGV